MNNFIIILFVLAIGFVSMWPMNELLEKAQHYEEALEYMESGNYRLCKSMFGQLSGYKEAEIFYVYSHLKCIYNPDDPSNTAYAYQMVQTIPRNYSGKYAGEIKELCVQIENSYNKA